MSTYRPHRNQLFSKYEKPHKSSHAQYIQGDVFSTLDIGFKKLCFPWPRLPISAKKKRNTC